MMLFYCTATNSLDIFSVSLFLANLDQTFFDFFSIFEWLIEICNIDEIQWHFYELKTKFYLWAANWPFFQRGCEYSQTVRSYQTPQTSFEKSTHFWKLFHQKKLSERILYHTLNRIFRFLHSYTSISYIFCKINYDGQSRQVFS